MEPALTLSGGRNCTQPAIDDFPRDFFTQTQRENGAVVLHAFISLYLFVALAVVCDKFFVPAVDRICQALNMSNDVAGATFMAAATSAPELFVNVIGTFITEGDIGVGTIVGSAVFNILAVAACCGIGAGMVVPLDWWPLTRDCLAYGITVSILICIIHDERVEWYEALILVILYGVYIFVMYFDKSFQKCARRSLKNTTPSTKDVSQINLRSEMEPLESQLRIKPDHHTNSVEHLPVQYNGGIISPKQKVHSITTTTVDQISFTSRKNEDYKKISCSVKLNDCDIVHTRKSLVGMNTHDKDSISNPCDEVIVNTNRQIHNEGNEKKSQSKPEKIIPSSADIDDYEHSLWKWPTNRSCFTKTTWVVTWPIHLIFMFTIPDCEKPRFKKWFPLTFIMCIVWIGSLSYIVAWMITIIGDTLKIPDSVMGITFLAAGTSVPEAVSSVIVAKQGHGSMGISNSIGSNTFDILLCLGLPWLIKASLTPTEPGHHWVAINSAGLEYSAISLLSTLLMLYVTFSCNKFKLDAKVGRACLCMYAVFLVLATLIELNVFFKVNLPTCTRPM